MILSGFDVFVGKPYESGGLFRLLVLSNNFAFVVCNNLHSGDLWHSCLCHVSFKAIKRVSDMSLCEGAIQIVFILIK